MAFDVSVGDALRLQMPKQFIIIIISECRFASNTYCKMSIGIKPGPGIFNPKGMYIFFKWAGPGLENLWHVGGLLVFAVN